MPPEFPEGFDPPDWTVPVDLDELRALCPDDAVCKGMFFLDLLKLLDRAGETPEGDPRYVIYKDYSQLSFIDIAVECARKISPDVPLAEGIFRLGLTSYPTVVSSTIGKMVFGVLGNNLPRIFRVANKGYRISMSHAQAQTLETSEHHALVQLDDIFVHPASYQVGVMTGALAAVGTTGEVRCKRMGPASYQYFVRWD